MPTFDENWRGSIVVKAFELEVPIDGEKMKVEKEWVDGELDLRLECDYWLQCLKLSVHDLEEVAALEMAYNYNLLLTD